MTKMFYISALICLMLASAGADEPPQRPDFVPIIADRMAWDDRGNHGNQKVRTPNLDRLAGKGMRFDRAFVTASSCSPSRSSYLTGRYPRNTGVEELHWLLPPDQVTFVERLKASGHWTATVGTRHLGSTVKDRLVVIRAADPSGFRFETGKDVKTQIAAQSGCGLWASVPRDRPTGKSFFLWLAARKRTVPNPAKATFDGRRHEICQADPTLLASYTAMAGVMLNLNETIMLE